MRYLMIPILVLIALLPIDANADPIEAEAGWSPPVYGTPVVRYVLEHSINGGDWFLEATTTDTIVTITISFEDCHRVRVAGVDAEDRQGPFSLSSGSYCPAAVMPGQPTHDANTGCFLRRKS